MRFERTAYPTEENLIVRLENGVERKEIVFFSLLEDEEVCKES